MDSVSINKKNMIILLSIIMAIIVGIVLFFVIYSINSNKYNAEKSDGPYNITVSVGGIPSSEVDITWTTDASSRGSFVQYIKYDSHSDTPPDFDKINVTLYEGYMEEDEFFFPISGHEYEQYPELNSSPVVIHRCFLTGLEENTKYWYRVGDLQSGKWSDIYTFKTAYSDNKMSEDGFRFLLFSDSQGFVYSDMEVWNKVLSTSVNKYRNVDFLVHMGDFVENAKNALLWQYTLGLSPEIVRNNTVIPVIGNKDMNYVMKYFTAGSESDAAIYNGWYSFDYEGVHFTVINSGDETNITNQQIKWIKKDLAAASDSLWRIVLIHKAPYSDGNHADDSDVVYLRGKLMPIFEQYNVDLVVQGHDHYYFRSEPVVNGNIADYSISDGLITDAGGPIYFMNGAAGVKQYDKTFRDMTDEIHTSYRTLLKSPSFSHCTVNATSVLFETYTVNRYTGAMDLVESWGIQK